MTAVAITMSTLEKTASATGLDIREKAAKESILSRVLKLFCSVRLGVVLLVLLGLACLIGMLIMQQSVDGFSGYYSSLTPAQRLVYGRLGFFNIYHAWYFNALLAVLSLNIILASVDRFPKTWKYVSKPNLTVPLRWLRDQKQSASIAVDGTREAVTETVRNAMVAAGWRKPVISEKNGRIFVFAQSGTWNRFGAYAVHVALLTIFVGGFLTSQVGTTGNLALSPGEESDLISENVVELDQVDQVTRKLPFKVTFTDIEQKLIREDGPITAGNTIDWITRFTIDDAGNKYDGFVQMNRPFDYRGYRFFQASFVAVGRARNISVRVKPADGGPTQDLSIGRDGTASLADGTMIRFSEFRGSFRIGPEDLNEDTSSYPNPAAILQVIAPNAVPLTAYAFGPQMASMPVAKNPVAGYTYELIDFEKVSEQHILSVQYDPGANVVYLGFLLLFLTLVAVFFFSHQRVWAAIEIRDDGVNDIIVAGNTNRNHNAFEEKFKRFVAELTSKN